MKIFGIQIGGSHDDKVEETPVLKESEHYPVDQAGVDEEAIMRKVQNVRVCSRCAAVYYGAHSCRW